MNAKMFIELGGHSNNVNILFDAITTDDLLGTVLRIHLACEQLVEFWIFSAVNNENIFNEDNGRLSVNFYSKLVIANNLGLPSTLFNVIKKINHIRNKFAHRNTNISISESDFISMIDNLNNCKLTVPDFSVIEGVTTFNINNTTVDYCLGDESTPDKYRLAIIYSHLLRKIAFSAVNQDPNYNW